ncbi:MAG: HEAT repeat domain-containing protein [Anaerolineae bacterium]
MADKKKQLLAHLSAANHQHLNELNDERERAIAKMRDLGARTDASTRQTLIGYLTQQDNDLLRPLAASRLSEIGGRDVVRELLALLDTETLEDSIRALIVQIIAEIGDSHATPHLIRLLYQSDWVETQRRTAFALGKTGGDGVYEALNQTLHDAQDKKLRQQVIAALGWLGDVRCIPDLLQIMQIDPDKETRTFAVEALGRTGADECYQPLVNLLHSDDLPIVRYYAAHALGLMADRRAIPHLERITNDSQEHAWVAQMARESLAKLSA